MLQLTPCNTLFVVVTFDLRVLSFRICSGFLHWFSYEQPVYVLVATIYYILQPTTLLCISCLVRKVF